MKKVLKISIMLLFTLLFIGTIVNAADEKVTLTADKTTISEGDTFTVILSAESEDGLNGLETEIKYDSTKLEKTGLELVDSTKWANLGSNDKISLLCNTEEKITTADLVKITFKVKEGITDSEQIKISTSSITLATDVTTKTIEAKSVSLTAKKVAGAEEKPIVNNTTTTTTTTNKTATVTVSGNNVDTSKSDKEISKTGLETVIAPALAIVVIVTIIAYVQNRKFKNI